MQERVVGPRFGLFSSVLSVVNRRLRDSAVRALRPHWIRQALGTAPEVYERFAPLRLMSSLPDGQRLAVIAPHPDDESIGAGGLLALWVAAGRLAEVSFLTDGAAGNPALRDGKLSSAQRRVLAQDTARKRRAEAAAALAILQAKGIWLDGSDGALGRDHARLTARLGVQWRAAPPDILVVPFPADRHPDHAAAARIAAIAAQGALDPATSVFCYEVWSPCPANTILDISTVAEIKARAIAAHESQTASTDYLRASAGLATYRAITAGLPAPALAEAFYHCTLAELVSLCDRLRV